MSKNIFYNFFILIIIFDISRSSIIASQWVELGLTVIMLLIHLAKKGTIDSKIIYVIIIWFIINFGAIIITGSQIPLLRITKFAIIFLLFPYLTLQTIGISFWYRFEKIIYILTFISLPIFLINIMVPQYFNSMLDTFRPLTRGIFHKFDYNSNYWSSIIYVNAIEDKGNYRNCGFMWEPGAFAMMIIWAIVFNWHTKGLQLNIRFVIYTIALATTLSTAGYLAFFVLITAFYVNKMTFKNGIVITLASIMFIFYIYKLNFMEAKLNKYVEYYEADVKPYHKDYEVVKVNRLQIVKYDVKEVLKYPFGYGYGEKSEIVGTNGLSTLLKIWGIPIFIFIIFLMRRYLNLFKLHHMKKLTIIILLIGILMMFFSNPIARNVFVYFILLTPLMFKERKIKYEEF